MFVSRFNNSVEPSSSNHHYFTLINEKSLHIAEKRALLIIHSSLSLPRHVMFHKDSPFIAALLLAPFFFYLTSEQTFFSASSHVRLRYRSWRPAGMERVRCGTWRAGSCCRVSTGTPPTCSVWTWRPLRLETRLCQGWEVLPLFWCQNNSWLLKMLNTLLPYSVSLAGLR